jgi:hypothetical protein
MSVGMRDSDFELTGGQQTQVNPHMLMVTPYEGYVAVASTQCAHSR